MNCASRPDRLARGRREGGLTLIETLVAIAVVLAFFSGAIFAFLEIIRTKERTQARLEAVANARHALETMTLQIKKARLLPTDSTTGTAVRDMFSGSTTFDTEGDRVDNDLDGQKDEERFDGADDDADWTLPDDRHAAITTGSLTYYERPAYRTRADLDDAHVDEDTLFSSSTLSFETFPLPGGASQRRVTFSLGNDLDGQPNTLMMQTEEFDPLTSTTTAESPAPIAHHVLSFTALYYDASERVKDPPVNPWKSEWSSTDGSRDRTTVPSVPPSVYLSLSVYSGAQPLSSVGPEQEIETVNLDTVVNVESVLVDPRYEGNLRPALVAVTP